MNKEGYWIFGSSWTWEEDTHCRVGTQEEVYKKLEELERLDRKNFGGPPNRPLRSYTVIKGTKIKL